MESNEISMLLDVKVDIKEKCFEMLSLRSWTKCVVKIEAIKCFPCYIKITFLKDRLDTKSDLVTRINLPGLHIQMAMSRTKNYAYGLFWKHNRKKSTAFFGFESKQNCEEHMKWIKMSINNLELHRQEILQSRRIGRTIDGLVVDDTNSCDISKDTLQLYQNLHETQDIKDVNDILGPLPNIPANDPNWSRRLSGMSGIYEEIGDDSSLRKNNRRISRNSVASGIYEEMKPFPPLIVEPSTSETGSELKTPPPLPPRTRINTLEYEEIPRAYTNPESDTMSKFRKVICGSTTSEIDKKPAQDDLMMLRRNKLKPKYLGFDLPDAKRYSLSSPDLTKFSYLLNVNNDASSTEDFDYHSTSGSNEIKLEANESIPAVIDEDEVNLNISEKIQSNFNFSCANTSKVNLIGASVLNDESLHQGVTLRHKFSIDYDLGYCVMTPPAIKNSLSISSSNSSKMSTNSSTTASSASPKNPNCFDIQFRFDEILTSTTSIKSNNSIIYENLGLTDSNHYVDMTQRIPAHEISSTDHDQQLNYDSPKRIMENNNICGNRNSVDDKISSYYPNNYKVTTKNNKNENLYNITPKLNGRKLNNNDSNKKLKTTSSYVKATPITASQSEGTIRQQTRDGTSVSTATSQPLSQRIYQKYATMSRASCRYFGSPKSSSSLSVSSVISPTNVVDSGRKFATVRFRRIDLSPLKNKINNVLARHNSGGL